MKYSKTEENLNVITHAFGVLLSVPAIYFLLLKSDSAFEVLGSLIFGISLLVLYLASTLYHATVNEKRRKKMRILDHSAIFILIAGTYTPVCLVSLWDSWGQLLLIVIWTIALLGIIAKIFLTGKYDRASTILYVAMGWIAIAIVKPLFDSLSSDALLWLLYGGICYTLGAVLYSFQKIKFNHSIFHLFVLGGSYCHFVMVHNHII